MNNLIKRLYSSAQEVLYIVCVIAWEKCRSLLSTFNQFSGIYTDQYVSDAIEAVRAAEAIKVSTRRNADKKEARAKAIEGTVDFLRQFKKLRQYIKRAFPKNIVADKLQSAGNAYYAAAAQKKWTAVTAMVKASVDFVAENLAALHANHNMPAGFETIFKDYADKCAQLVQNYMNIEIEMEELTTKKVKANNAIYETLMQMLADAQEAITDEETRKTFVFAYLRKIAKAKSPASLKGYVLDEHGNGIAGATVYVPESDYTATTNARGYYKITQMLAAEYRVIASIDGMEPMEQIVKLKPATAHMLRFVLANVQEKAA